MIISNTHRFAFIHIPKCAGTTIRNPLLEFDDCNGAHTARVAAHPFLGNLDYVHIPLFTLRDHFEEEFKAITGYWSFAVVRDPFARFPSSVSQRLKMYSDQPIHRCSVDDIKKAVDESIAYLSQLPRGNHRLPPEYIHFQRQIDYTELDGEQIIDSLYTVDDVDNLLEDVGQHVGHSMGKDRRSGEVQPRTNQSFVFRNDFLRWMIETSRPLSKQVSRLLPEGVKQQVRKQVYTHRDQRMKALFDANYVQGFIRDYYAKDIALYTQVNRHGQVKAS